MITENSKVVITKGCRDLGLDKGVTCTVVALEERERREIRMVLSPINGFKAGKRIALYVRHANRLADSEVRMNNGDPTKVVMVRAVK